MKITLVGMGSGAPGSLTAAGLETLRGAELIIGARRLLENLPEGCTANRTALYKTDEICALLRQTDCAEAAVVFSGDTGFDLRRGGALPRIGRRGSAVHGAARRFQRAIIRRGTGPPVAGLAARLRPRMCL